MVIDTRLIDHPGMVVTRRFARRRDRAVDEAPRGLAGTSARIDAANLP